MNQSKLVFGLSVMMLLISSKTEAQAFQDAGEYMSYIGKNNDELTVVYLSYISAVAHNKSARKVEKRRNEVVNAIYETRVKIQGMPPWKGDKSYRDTTVGYLKLLDKVFREDYAKIVNMEEIAEQSYDAMEAYMLAQEKAYEKLDQASDRQHEMQRKFANKYNINLVDNETDLDRKSKIASELNRHYNEVYLIFFKASKQEAYLMDAISKKNIIAIEENKNSMKRFAEEGLEKIKEVKAYNGDQAIISACRDALVFFKTEAEEMQAATDFFMKEEAFNKLKKNFDSKPANQRTDKDIDQFNKAVNDINAGVKKYNETNKQLNKQRSAVLDKWNNTVKRFMDNYMPVQRKA
jgi:hypothetical protein